MRNTPVFREIRISPKRSLPATNWPGFLTAVSLVKPTKSIFDVDVANVRKKMKDKAFARGVNREDIVSGAQELGVDLDAHIAFCIAALRRSAAVLGLDGVAPSHPRAEDKAAVTDPIA